MTTAASLTVHQAFERVLQTLEQRRCHVEHAEGTDKAKALCPAHGDRTASLSIGIKDNKVVVHCFSGCSFEQIAEALDLTPSAFFGRGEGAVYPADCPATLQSVPPAIETKPTDGLQPPEQPNATLQPSGCTLAEYAAAKILPPGFLKMQGLNQFTYDGAPAVRIPYRDESGVEDGAQFRVTLKKSPEGDGRFKWKKGCKATLYGRWRLPEERRRKAGYIVLVEGASDCHTLWYHGIAALGIPGANTWKDDRDVRYFNGFSTIYVVIEPDQGGERVKEWLAKASIRDRVRLLKLGEHKDPSALHIACQADKEQFKAAWDAVVTASVAWTEIEQTERTARASSAWSQCQDLARKPRILDEFANVLASSGLAGEQRVVKLLYLAVTSRFLPKPVSLALKGPSSAGKSHTTERVLAFFPSSAVYALSAMSERALAYSEEPLSHRMLVIYEAAGIRGDFATYLLRSLLSEGRVRYETVEKTSEGLKPKLIEREGPTGLLVTTTAVQLHPENETRMLSVSVTDTPAQTKAVLLAQARETTIEVDMVPWLALQNWLDGAEHRVTIPYAQQLAEAIPPLAVRLRRDFPNVLQLIRSHALLHQESRARDAMGRIIATAEDYAQVRELVYDLVADAIGATVPPTVRETVNAVADLVRDSTDVGVTINAVAKRLDIDKSAALRRVQVAEKRGYVRNLEDKRGRPARLVTCDPMPDDQIVLPEAGKLVDVVACNLQPQIGPSATTQPQETSGLRSTGCRVACESGGIIAPLPPSGELDGEE